MRVQFWRCVRWNATAVLTLMIFLGLSAARPAQAQTVPDLTKYNPVQINFSFAHNYGTTLTVNGQNANGDFTGTLHYGSNFLGVSGHIGSTFFGTSISFTAQNGTSLSMRFNGAINVEGGGSELFLAGTYSSSFHGGFFYYLHMGPFCAETTLIPGPPR